VVASLYRSLVCFALSSLLLLASAHALDIAEAPAVLVAKAKENGLVDAGPVMPHFTWTIDIKKPLRSANRQTEIFLGAASAKQPGLSVVKRTRFEGIAAGAPSKFEEHFSARGMMNFRADETEPEIALFGLKWPLATDQHFKFAFHDEHGKIDQACHIVGVKPAALLNVSLKKNAHQIHCDGAGKYRGFEAQVTSVVWFIEELGVFFNTEDVFKTALGRFVATVKLVDVKIH
jgi:hypothetical protein